MFPFIALFSVFCLSANAAGIAPLPPEVIRQPADDAACAVKTSACTFTPRYEIRLTDGRLYRRPVSAGQWNRLDTPFGAVREISADGDNLIAVTADRRVHYAKLYDMKWTGKWGKPAAKPLYLPINRAWAISHLNETDAGGYEDPSGKFIPAGTGVTTLYVLSPDGLHLNYADPWLMPDFLHRIPMPERGCFRAAAMSASGSIIFLINAQGRMYTRLADFDTTGADPRFPYTFRDADGTSNIIKLPAEQWRRQPDITTGRLTSAITIITDGRGNAGRLLRVQGTDRYGLMGYYHKHIFDDTWKFVPSAQAQAAPFLDAANETDGPVTDGDYPVTLVRGGKNVLCKGAKLSGFSADNDTADLLIPLKSGKLVITLYTRESFIAGQFYGTLVVPEEALKSADAETLAAIKRVTGGRSLLDVRVRFSDGKASLSVFNWRKYRESAARLLGI